MSKVSSWVIPFIVGFFIGGPVLLGFLHLSWGESPQQAYERGYKDAHWFVKYDIELNPTVVVDNLGRTWHRVDSTDTLPAVDSVVYIDTFYKRDGVWRIDSVDTLEAREG